MAVKHQMEVSHSVSTCIHTSLWNWQYP